MNQGVAVSVGPVREVREELFTCSLRANRWLHSPPCVWSLLPFLSYLGFSCNMMHIGFNCNIIGWNKSYYLMCMCVLSHVWLCDRMDCSPPGFSVHGINISPRQEYWSGLPFPSPGDHPSPGIEHITLVSPSLAGGLFTTEPPGKPLRDCVYSDAAFLSWNISGIPVRKIECVCVCVCVCVVVFFFFFLKLYLAVADLHLSF